jgi:hypothetical protein
MDEMATADTQMANILHVEMDELTRTRDIIDGAMRAIQIAIPIALMLKAIPWCGSGVELGGVIGVPNLALLQAAVGASVSEKFQIAVAISTTTTALVALAKQLEWCAGHSRRVASQTAKYQEVQETAELYLKLGLWDPRVTSPSPGARPSLTGSGSGWRGPVGGGADSNAARRSTSGSRSGDLVAGGEVPAASGSGSGGPVGVGAPAGVVGDIFTAGSARSGSGDQSASQGGKKPRPSASVKSSERAGGDATDAAEAGAGPGPQSRVGRAGAERAPVDAGTATPEETPEGSTPNKRVETTAS